MKSKKTKGNPASPRSSEEDLALPSHRGNAFSFLKNRFFLGSTTNNNNSPGYPQQQQQQQQQHKLLVDNEKSTGSSSSSPRPSTSTRSTTKPWSIDNNDVLISDKPLSRSFDEHSISEFNNNNNKSSTLTTPRTMTRNARPMSMMGMEGLSLMQQSELTSLPTTIAVAKPDAFVTPRRRNSTTNSATTTTTAKVTTDTTSTGVTIAEKRTSLIILKEGYLFKKTDFKPFHKQTKLDRGWKLYRVVLRGHKLYLYKLTTESPLRSLFPSPNNHHSRDHNQTQQSLQSLASHHSLTFSLSSSSISSSNNITIPSLKLVRSDFDCEAQQVFFPTNNSNGTAQGSIFMELNQVTMQPKQQVNLILTNDGFLYVCDRPDNVSSLWTVDTKISLSFLKIEAIPQSADIEATSPSSFTSVQSDPFFRNSHSNGLLLFSISYINRPSILGVYSTQYREIGQAWISTFQNNIHHATSSSSTKEDLSSSRSGGSLWRVEEDWDDSTTLNNNNANSTSSGRMYDATQRYHPDLIHHRNHRSDIEEKGPIKGGTINALIHELLFNNDDHLLDVFLLTYSTFTTGSRVLNEFKLILSKNSALESHLLDICVAWCDRFSLDVMGDVASGMMSILEQDDIVDKKRAKQVKELVLKTVTENANRNCEHNNACGNSDDIIISAEKSNSNLLLLIEEDEERDSSSDDSREVENITAYDVEGKRRNSINLSNLLITGLTPAVFLIIDPTGFAQQIYLFHYSKQKQYEQDLLNPLSYLPRPQLSVQMLNSLLFSTVAPHFLTKLIRNQILIDTQQEVEESTLIRSRLLEHWIRIGIHLLELGDMTGWCAVAMGVCSVGIVRLRETWKAVDRDLVNRVQGDWARILTDYGLFTQNVWAEGWDGQPTVTFSKVLDIHDTELHDIEARPYTRLPFFGTIRQSVDRLRKHVKKLLGPNIVNFDECQCIYDTITSSLNHWKSTQHQQDDGNRVKSLPIVGPLQSFFEHSITDLMSVPHDYKYLQECSLACEPRIFGQGFDRRKFSGRAAGQASGSGSDVAPPSASSLVFPSILDNCSLLDVDHVTTPATTTTSTTGSACLASAASSTALSLASSQQQSSHKKTHPRKMGTYNSIRSIRSFLEDDSKKQQQQTSSNLASLTGASSSNSSLNNTTAQSHDIISPSKGANRKAFRRRTYSFPPGSGNTNASSGNSKYDLLESENSRTWLGSLISNRHHRTYSTKALIEAHRKSRAAQYGHNGEIILSVQQGELVFKATAILKKDAATSGDENVLEKTESAHSIDFLKKDESNDNEDALLVTVKAGYLEHLVDSLVRGVLPHEEALKDQWQMMSLAEGLQHQVQPGKVAMDEEEYINVFFTTFRIYCSPVHLLDMLRKKFMDAKSKCKSSLKKRKNSLILLETYFTPDGGSASKAKEQSEETSEIDFYDWKKVADIQLRVLNLFMYWVEEHPYDFIDEIEISHYIGIFLTNAKQALEEWRVPLSKYNQESKENKTQHVEALTMAHTIEQRIIDLRTQCIRKSLSPCYDIKAIQFDPESTRGAEELYRQLTSGTQRYHTTLQLATNKLIPLSISTRPRDTDAKSLVDRFAPEALLEQVDKAVRQLFGAVTMQDWIQTFDVFEAQTGDLYAWLPARKPSRTSRMSASLTPVIDAPSSHLPSYHVLSDEVIISDIFTAIEGARRSVVSPSAFSDDDLLLAFPGSIQYLYCMHFIIRSWVINEIAAMDIDSKTRVLRIEKFLQIVMLSKISSEKMTLFPELKEASAGGKTNSRVPGFVEYAIASALVSPEARLFTKVWNDVAMQHGHANLDTLENLLNQIQKTQPMVSSNTSRTLSSTFSSSSISSSTTSSQQQLIVPSLGWIFERIMELCFHIPDTFDKKDNMINFDKRRCVYQFLQLIMNVQVDLDEQQVEAKGISMSFLISPNLSMDNWKGLRELAVRENKKAAMGSSGSLVLRGPSSKSYVSRSTVFSKLVTEQMDKLKRDFKERDRIDKEWLLLQHKLQKKQIEHARLVEKQDRKAGISKSSTQQQLQQQSNSVMPRINSFLRGLRPQSMVTSPIQYIFPPNIQIDANQQQHHHLSTTKASTVINLIHSTTSVASTYTKRDYVFRIVTEEGGQYLFQAMNREDMHDWMQHVNNSAREGAAKRQSVLAAESLDNEGGNQQRRQSAVLLGGGSPNRNQPASRTSVYGVALDSLMRDGKVPMVVDKCIREIERRGLEEVGIYRVAGTGSVVSALKAEFNKDVNKVDLTSPAWADINVVADAFKQFLRELPEPLLTYTYYDEFINASASEDHDERVYLIKKVIKKLPYSNYVLLKRIIEHFVIVTDFEATNHMYATNLAIVFGPTLLQPTPGPASFATTMSNLGHHQNIVKYLILNYHYLFDVESDEVETLSKEEDQTTQSQEQPQEEDEQQQVSK